MRSSGMGDTFCTSRMVSVAARRVCACMTLIALLYPSVALSPAIAAPVSRVGRVSVGVDGAQADTDSLLPVTSDDGRFVAFQSSSDALDGDTGGHVNVFVRDTVAGTTTLISAALGGSLADGDSFSPSISADGRYVAFASNATNLIVGDDNASTDVFVHDRQSGSTTMASITPAGLPGNADSHSPALSSDGAAIAFVSSASDLVAGDVAGNDDIFIRTFASSLTRRVSRGVNGVEANGHSSSPAINASGSRIAFGSAASNLVAGGDNGHQDVYVASVTASSISVTRASATAGGVEGNLGSFAPSIDAAGRRVAFESQASNLVGGDTNGVRDVFVVDLTTRAVARASLTSSGMQLAAASRDAAIDPVTARVAFSSTDSKVVPGDLNGVSDVFLRDLGTGSVQRVSVTTTGLATNGASSACRFATDGSAIGFHSFADNIVSADDNGAADAFLVTTGARVYERISGQSRYATAVETSKHVFPGGAPAVVVATGQNWPDALGGSALAGAAGGPLLLTEANRLTTVTRDEIARLAPQKIYILGGTNSVSAGVETSLKALVGASNVERLPGRDRYATSVLIAQKAITFRSGTFDGTVLVATGSNYPDALAGSPIAAATGRPIVLANPNTAGYTLPGGTTRAAILGGVNSVPSAVQTSLNNRLGAANVLRLGGRSRYDTAVLVADWGVADAGMAWHGVALTTGETFPDALSGGVMTARIGTVLLLTQGTVLTAGPSGKLSAAAGGIGEVHVIGGTASVTDSVMTSIKRACGD